MAVALITGIGGFVGQWLARYLLEQGDGVVGVARTPVRWHQPDLQDLSVEWCDLTDLACTRAVVGKVAPDHIYHLAAYSSPQQSRADPARFRQNNLSCQVNLLDAVRLEAPRARMLVVSSSNVYGSAPGEMPVDEQTPVQPANPYAESKVAQERAALRYHQDHGLDVVIVRSFNHTGPGQQVGFVVPDIAQQVAAIEIGEQEPVVTVQALDPGIDLTDVRDVARAYHLAVRGGEAGATYNVGSGRAWTVRALVDALRALSTAHPIEVREERPTAGARPALRCDSRRLQARVGWSPHLSIETTLLDTLNFWRQQKRDQGPPAQW
jgi:GDP-4-dehydro-6-deoxy-D-mannose reductase